MTVIHYSKGTVFILTGELAVIHCLSNSFTSRYHKYLQPSILSMVQCIFLKFKFAAIQFGQCTFFQRILPWNKLIIKATIFSEQHQLYFIWEQSLEAATYSLKYFFRIPRCPEKLLLSNNYFLKETFFLIRYVLRINTFWAQLLFRRSFFSRMSNHNLYFFEARAFSEQLLFQKRNFLRSRYFLGRVTFFW